MFPLDLVVLCGGKGSRLRNLTKSTPKPLLKVNKKIFLNYLLNFYKKFDINKIYLLTSYKSKKFKYYDKSFINFININCVNEQNPLGTGGGLLRLKSKLSKRFLVINGDSFLDYDLDNFIKNFNKSKKVAKILLIKNLNYFSNQKLSNLYINKKNEIVNKTNSNFMNAGIYIFKKEVLNFFNKTSKQISLENDVIPLLIKKKKIAGQIQNGDFIDIGTKKNYISASKILKKIFKKKSIILDRDGVCNHDFGYVHKFKNFKFRPGVIKGLRYLNNKSVKIFIATNQSGIGRGYYQVEDFIKLQKKIKSTLAKQRIYIDDVKYCPHHPKFATKQYKKKCKCRKPENKMIKDIISENFLIKKNIIFIGDKISDFYCAKKSGIKFAYPKKNFFNQVKELF